MNTSLVTLTAHNTSRTAWIRAASLFAAFAAAKLLLLVLRVTDAGLGAVSNLLLPVVLVYQDVLVACVWAVVDLSAARLAPRSKIVNCGLWVLYVFLVLYVAINVPVARVFATPLTYSMLGATGTALSDSIGAHVSFGNVLAIFVVTCVAIVTPRALGRSALLERRTLLVLTLALGAAGLLMAARTESLGLHRNAWMALIATSLARVSVSSEAGAGALTPLPVKGATLDLSHLRGAAAGRNVIWVILESTGARYLGSYGAKPDPTPRLTALATQAITFEHAYAAYPESIKGLHSMLCSAYPDPYLDVAEYVSHKKPCTPISQVLANAGYRSAFFHSGRFRYLGMRGIVEGRGFHELYDAATIGGKYASSFGTDDASTAERLLAFVDSLDKDQRFFAVYSPIAGHHPYRTPGPRAAVFSGSRDFDHYRNDLYTGDLAFGRIVDGIQKRGLAERTLWLIVGDHGEAFEQHPGNVAHTLHLYEENVHVPLIVSAPGVTTNGIRAPQIGSLVDLAPTTLSLLGLPLPKNFEGRSLLEPVAGSAVSFTDHDLLKASLRHGSWKFIYESEHKRSRLFDLERDPLEREDLVQANRALTETYKQWLVAWLKAKGAHN